jgi:uncharacterized protein
MKADSYFITTELFTIPYGDLFILYAPLKRVALLVSPKIICLLNEIFYPNRNYNFSLFDRSQLEILIELGIINGKRDKFQIHQKDFLPNHATIFLTTNCNLKCIYCYANAGDKREIIPNKIAIGAVDFIVNNSILSNKKVFSLTFHGGGEPTLAWNVLTKIVRYAKLQEKTNNLKLRLNLASNGIISNSKADYIIENFDSLTLSFDGTEYLQNLQRPLAIGKGSFKYVMKTINKFDSKNFNYGIRATVTDKSVTQLAEITQFIINNTKTNAIAFEPVSSCGRCVQTGVAAPSSNLFIDNFRIANAIAKEKNIKLIYSGARLTSLSETFCRASNDSFCVTTCGNITSCYEVCSTDNPLSKTFFYGKWNKNTSQFIFFNDKLNYLRKRKVKNLVFCSNCFCKYHCAGDCVAKMAEKNNILSMKIENRCKINQALTLDQIIDTLIAYKKEN